MIRANYCFQVKKVKLLKSFFNIESNVIKDDKSKLLFSRKKSLTPNRFGVILQQLIMCQLKILYL